LREVARWRARRRGIDVTGWYRDRLTTRPLPASGWAACLDALRRTGDPADLDLFLPGLEHPVAAVRAAALSGVGALAPADRARELVGPLLLDPSPRVSTTAARVLVGDRTGGAGAAADWASLAWASPRSSNRHAAWRLARTAGGWARVEADLRAAGDPDPRLAATGQAGIRNWLTASAATTWEVMAPQRRERIGDLIEAWDAPDLMRSTLAFHAGITRPATEPGPADDEAPVDEAPVVRETAARRVLRFLQRG
jgi:hypothetical protein